LRHEQVGDHDGNEPEVHDQDHRAPNGVRAKDQRPVWLQGGELVCGHCGNGFAR
jgi:hypothetical protein